MEAWRVYLLLCVWCNKMASPCGCYGPGPNSSECNCRMLGATETEYYIQEFTAPPDPDPESDELHPQFAAYPHSGTFARDTEVTLSCNISFAACVRDVDPCKTLVTWEHNGTAIESSSVLKQYCVYVDQDDVYSSTLTIPQFSASTEGDYVCRVGEGASAIVSPVATLQLPKFLGWIDRAYPPPLNANSVSLEVQKGGSAILECSPNTTESMEGVGPPQLQVSKGEATIILLPSGNVLVTDVQDDTNLSCVWVLWPSEMRQFHITVYSDPQKLKLVVRPKDTTVAAGSGVELYCIAEGHLPTIHWFKNGQEVNRALVGDGQVLEIEGVTAIDSGVYTCVASNRQTSLNASATVTVIDPPGTASLSASGDRIVGVQSGTVFLAEAGNSSLSLRCSVEGTGALHYQWLHGGVEIEAGLDRVTITLSTWSNATGSYQCVVSNIAGVVSSSTLWINTVRPHPPTDLWIRRNTHQHVYFQYDIGWNQPDPSWPLENYTVRALVKNYTVETLALVDTSYVNFCSCVDQHSDATNTVYAYQAGCPGSRFTTDYMLYYRVAANTDIAGQSIFTPGDNILVAAVAPPSVLNMEVESMTPNTTSHQWELSWEYQDKHLYSTNCYETEVTLPCSNAVIKRAKTPFMASMNCCTTCEWSVINRNNIYNNRISISSKNYTSPALKPSPPQLLSVKRVGTTGRSYSISFRLPKETMSCMCDLEGSFEVRVLTNDSSIQPTTKTLPLTARSFSILLPEADCYTPYTMSMAFNNSVGMSDYSNSLSISLPTGSNIPTFSNKELHYNYTNSTSVAVYYELEPGADCFLAKGILQARICYTLSAENNCTASLVDNANVTCVGIDGERGQIFLARYYDFCVMATISSSVPNFTDSVRTLKVSANESVPDKPSLSAEIVNGTLEISWRALPYKAWHGIPHSYTLNTTVNGRLVNSTQVHVQSDRNDFELYEPYDSTKSYNISLSACTSVGCGPIAFKYLPSNAQQGTNPPSSTSGSDNVLIITIISSVVAIILLALCLFTICCLCYRRRKKGVYSVLRNESEAEFPITLRSDNEPLQRDRQPPTGAVAPSEYTDFESLCSDSRVKDWVKQSVGRGRDGYMKDVEEELEKIENQHSNPHPAPAVPSASAIPLPSDPEMTGSDYCPETEAVLQSDGSSSATKNTSATVSSSGYSTEQSFKRVTTDASPAPQTQSRPAATGGYVQQTAHMGTHNHASAPAHHLPANSPLDTTNIACAVDNSPDDSILKFLCLEEFNQSVTSLCGDARMNSTCTTCTTGVGAAELLPITNMSLNAHITSTTHSTPLTACNGHHLESAKGEEETDSVFDNSIPPLSPTTTDNTQSRTSSNRTSGFCSLSNTSLDSIVTPSDNSVEMKPIQHHSSSVQSPAVSSCSAHRPAMPLTMSKMVVPVIPSLLPSQHTHQNTYQLSLHEVPGPCYENLDNDPLAHEDIQFEL